MLDIESLCSGMPESFRLAYVEGLLKDRKIDKETAKAMISRKPILQGELSEISEQVKRDLEKSLGLKISDYELEFDNNLHYVGGKAIAQTSISGKIFIPNQFSIEFPIVIAHELAHIYHGENSELYKRLRKNLRSPRSFDKFRGNRKFEQIREGFPTFISFLYARLRDSRLNDKLYEELFLETLRQNNMDYAAGFVYYKAVHNVEGLEGVLKLANRITKDDELAGYASRYLYTLAFPTP